MFTQSPRITLKNVHTYPRLSEETLAFDAVIYIDGKKAGTASNHGTGGENDAHFVSPEMAQTFASIIAALPAHESEYGTLPMSSDLYLSLALEAIDTLKTYKRWCKNATLFRLPGDVEGHWRSLKAPYTEKLGAALRTKYSSVEILNERPELRA